MLAEMKVGDYSTKTTNIKSPICIRDGRLDLVFNEQLQIRRDTPGIFEDDMISSGGYDFEFNSLSDLPEKEKVNLFKLMSEGEANSDVKNVEEGILSIGRGEERRLRFLGDVYKYKLHWIDGFHLKEFVERNFHTSIRYLENISYLGYICTNGWIRQIEKAKRMNKREEFGWDQVSHPGGQMGIYANEDPRRAYCIGCTMRKNARQRFLMTAIDCDTNGLVLVDMGVQQISCLKYLFEKEKKNGYDRIEQWLYDYDVIISKDENSISNYGIQAFPSKYNNLRGYSPILNYQYAIRNKAVRQALKYNLYSGDIYIRHMNKRPLANICEIGEDGVKFSFLDKDKEYLSFSLLENQGSFVEISTKADLLEI